MEETKHRFTVAAMKSLRKYGYVKQELAPLTLDKSDILECIDFARFLTKI